MRMRKEKGALVMFRDSFRDYVMAFFVGASIALVVWAYKFNQKLEEVEKTIEVLEGIRGEMRK